ncbi:malectin domain-containing carbohydrate-binding protein, partial [Rhodocytophaga aerolata]
NEFSYTQPASATLAAGASTTVSVSFRPSSRGIKNAALLVHYDNSPTPLRIPLYGTANDNCSAITVAKRIKGAADAPLTINGITWEADNTYRKGSVQLDRPAATPIAATDDDLLYQSYLSAATNLGVTRYEVPLPNGNYMIRMHFVENFFTTVASRVFDISIENQRRLAFFDIFSEVGYKSALVKDFEVSITDGRLDVSFTPTANRVAIAGMEIYNAG